MFLQTISNPSPAIGRLVGWWGERSNDPGLRCLDPRVRTGGPCTQSLNLGCNHLRRWLDSPQPTLAGLDSLVRLQTPPWLDSPNHTLAVVPTIQSVFCFVCLLRVELLTGFSTGFSTVRPCAMKTATRRAAALCVTALCASESDNV